jgi:hypothetical protein
MPSSIYERGIKGFKVKQTQFFGNKKINSINYKINLHRVWLCLRYKVLTIWKNTLAV